MSWRRKTLRPTSLGKLAVKDTENEAEKASRKKLWLDKKQELTYLEAQASKVNDVRVLLLYIMQLRRSALPRAGPSASSASA